MLQLQAELSQLGPSLNDSQLRSHHSILERKWEAIKTAVMQDAEQLRAEVSEEGDDRQAAVSVLAEHRHANARAVADMHGAWSPGGDDRPTASSAMAAPSDGDSSDSEQNDDSDYG